MNTSVHAVVPTYSISICIYILLRNYTRFLSYQFEVPGTGKKHWYIIISVLFSGIYNESLLYSRIDLSKHIRYTVVVLILVQQQLWQLPWYWNSWNSVKPHRGIEEVLTPSKRVLTPSIPWQYPYWVPNTYPIPLWGRYWVPNTCFEKHSLINRELCERSFVGFLKQHDTFYNHVCKVFQQYRIIYNSTEYSWFSA